MCVTVTRMINSREFCKHIFISEESGYNDENVDMVMAKQISIKTLKFESRKKKARIAYFLRFYTHRILI